MSTTRNNKSVADIIHHNLTTQHKDYVENPRLVHEVLIRSMESGVPGAILQSVITNIPITIVANAMGTGAKNIRKLAKKGLNRYRADVLIDLSCLWCELRQFFNFDERFLREWVITPLPALAGVSPGLLMSSIAGRNELRKLLCIMRNGDFC